MTPPPPVDSEDRAGASFNNFLLVMEDRIVLKEIPTGSSDPSRQKQLHRKSRRGCSNCRKRRVKVQALASS
jgi:hypothetical protein